MLSYDSSLAFSLFDTFIIKQPHDDKQTSFFPTTRKLHDFDKQKST